MRSSTSTCTASLRNAGTTTGTAFVTLTVRDLYGQVTSTSATVTILPPAAPTISITGGGTQGVTVNGAIAPVTFTLTGMAPLTVTPNTSDFPPSPSHQVAAHHDDLYGQSGFGAKYARYGDSYIES